DPCNFVCTKSAVITFPGNPIKS
ncbi:jg15126, partial [Pararge aegeria aegeria]